MVQNIISFFESPRFLSFVGHGAAIGAIAGINYLADNASLFNLSTFWVTVIGLVTAQLVGALKNYANEQPTGLVKR